MRTICVLFAYKKVSFRVKINHIFAEKITNILKLIIMKARRILTLSLLIAMFSFCLSAQEQISANSEKLNREQRETLKYAKKLLNRLDGKVALPLEINALIGDSVTKAQYHAIPLWDDAYFEDTKDYLSHIVIPLKTDTPQGTVLSCLNIRYGKRYNFLRTVETRLSIPDQEQTTENTFSGIVIKSNVEGLFMRSFVYNKGELIEQIEGMIGNKGYVDYRRKYAGPNIKPKRTIGQMGVERFRYVANLKDKYNNPAHWMYGEAFFDRVKRLEY